MKIVEIEVFKPGRYGNSEGRIWSATEVQEMRDNYDPEYRDAPVILGHNDWGGEKPAYGWVKSLDVNDNGVLVAKVEYNDELEEYVKAGMFRRVSIEATKKIELFDQGSGKTGPYLLAVALLGSNQPAVSGLKPVKFEAEKAKFVESFEFSADENGSDDEEHFEGENHENNPSEEGDTMATGEQNAPNTTEEEYEVTKEELEKFQKEQERLQAEKAAFEAEKKKIEEEKAAFLAEKRKLDVESFISANSKKIAPAVRDDIQEFMAGLDDENLDKFKKIINKMPEAALFEQSMSDGQNEEPDTDLDEKFQKQALEDIEKAKKA